MPILRLSLLKASLHLWALAPLLWLILAIAYNWWSADPIKELQHFSGRMGLTLLIAVLAISPLSLNPHFIALNGCRRLLGLWTFFWVSLHALSYAYFELGLSMSFFINEVTSRFYLSLGMLSWCILLLLALTSLGVLRQKLGRHWSTLHQSLYLVALLAPIHALLSTKILQWNLFFYALPCLCFVLWRYGKRLIKIF